MPEKKRSLYFQKNGFSAPSENIVANVHLPSNTEAHRINFSTYLHMQNEDSILVCRQST